MTRETDPAPLDGREALLQGMRNHRILFERTIRTLNERSPESAKSHIVRWSRAAVEDIDALLAALPDSGERPGLRELETELVLRAGHLPSCGDGAEFPWDCTCDYAGFMERMGRVLATPTRDAQPAEERLDEAWAEAEAALPDRYGLTLRAWGTQYTGEKVQATADMLSAPTEADLRAAPTYHGSGPTPVAALRALTEALSSTSTATEERE